MYARGVRAACLLACLSVFVLACSSEADPAPQATSVSGAGGATSSGAASATTTAGVGGQASLIEIEATEGSLLLDFDIALTGAGSDFVGAVEVAAASGTVEIGGESLPAVAYERQPFGQFVLYQMLAVASDRWYVLWAYCQGADLAWI